MEIGVSAISEFLGILTVCLYPFFRYTPVHNDFKNVSMASSKRSLHNCILRYTFIMV